MNMFGRRKKNRTKGSDGTTENTGLKLGTGDRSTVRSTKSSDTLAREILESARKKAEGLKSGATVSVEITEAHPHIHHMELMLSFMLLASEFGLQAGTQFDNTFSFTKL
jgi:hypothetical protein